MQLSKKFMTPEGKKMGFKKADKQISVKQKMDLLLKHDFQLLRQENMDSSQKLLLRTNNATILEYVKTVYNQFNISDPLGQINMSYFSSQPSGIKTIKKQRINMMSNQTLMYSATPKNVSSVPSQYPLNNAQFDALRNNYQFKKEFSSHLNTTFYHNLDRPSLQNNRHNQSLTDLFRSLNIREADNKDYNKQVNNSNKHEMIIEEQTRISLQDQYPANMIEDLKQSKNITKDITNVKLKRNPKQFQQTFRYCVGCQKPIIEANKQLHQGICNEFRAILSMSKDGFITHLCQKVENMKQKVDNSLKQLSHQDSSKFKQSSLKLAQQAKTILQTGIVTEAFRKEYIRAIQIGKKRCLISQQINKIHWFLKIIYQRRSRIQQQ